MTKALGQIGVPWLLHLRETRLKDFTLQRPAAPVRVPQEGAAAAAAAAQVGQQSMAPWASSCCTMSFVFLLPWLGGVVRCCRQLQRVSPADCCALSKLQRQLTRQRDGAGAGQHTGLLGFGENRE